MMKLGSQTGSMMNHLMSRMTKGAPETTIGMGATVLRWTDRTACTITAIDGDVVTVTEDVTVRTDKNGMSEAQEYEYALNPEGARHQFRRNEKGEWVEVIRNLKTGRLNNVKSGKGLLIGERCHYHDFSF